MKTIKKLFFGILFISGITVNAQDPHFSQIFSNPLFLNPAFAGSAGCSRVAMNVRSQWPDISGGGYKTSSISFDQYSSRLKGGIGITYLYDNAYGTLFTHKIEVDYTYNIKCSENFNIRPAASLGLYRKSLDGSQFIPPPSNSVNVFFNAGAGVLMIYKKMTGGFAIDHINEPDEGFFSTSRLPAKYTAHLSWQGIIGEKLNMTPILMFQKQKDFEQLLPCLLFNVSYLKFGAGLRFGFENPDSFISMIGFQNHKLSIGYSYDYTISKLTNSTGGTHEISAVIKFRCNNAPDHFLIPLINNF